MKVKSTIENGVKTTIIDITGEPTESETYPALACVKKCLEEIFPRIDRKELAGCWLWMHVEPCENDQDDEPDGLSVKFVKPEVAEADIRSYKYHPLTVAFFEFTEDMTADSVFSVCLIEMAEHAMHIKGLMARV